jgi:hypothetical protein
MMGRRGYAPACLDSGVAMHEFIKAADDVVALTVRGEITGADMDAVISRLEERLARHEKVHVFVEARALDGVALSDLGAQLPRALPMAGQLARFGRVAVVADQSWVRVGSRLESALLPFVGYRVFKPEQRTEALAWVMHG